MARQAKAKTATPAAVHSYLHLVRKNGVHPYIKRHSAERARAASPWSVPDLCAAYDWPNGLAGPRRHRDHRTRRRLDPGRRRPVLRRRQSAGAQHYRRFGRWHEEQSLQSAKRRRRGGRARHPGRRRRLRRGHGQACEIRVYWSQDITQAVAAATADGCDVCSISWGADEANWGAAAGDAMEQAAAAATAAGMFVFAASGDNDSSDGGPGRANVDLPASAPHVIGCGGTNEAAHRRRNGLER